jgi:maltooligosyltrehalose trehalohydrolase
VKTATNLDLYGANYHDGVTDFRLWAPKAKNIILRLIRGGQYEHHDYEMRRLGSSNFGVRDFEEAQDAETFTLQIDARPGDRYFYIVDGSKPLPDPVSRFLPNGVHGPSEIVDPNAFHWTDQRWCGLDFLEYVIYELHVGTFTKEGTLDSAITKLSYLKDLGVTAIELMPVNAFPGHHNWGYDGVGQYAVQASYGGPDALRRFVNAAHEHGLAVIQDVVYNHFGNEGNYLREFGPYFTAKHKTPWGEAINYDDEQCAAVRRFIVSNALYWIVEYHMDGLRLDAVQTIKDDSEKHIVAEIAEGVHALGHQLGRTVVVTVETDENDAKYITEYGANGVWSDDFHHVIHAMLTGESKGYYQDFAGRTDLLPRVLNEGFGFQGEMFKFWNGGRGTSAEGVALPANIICIQNHDQIGNRATGDRLPAGAPRGARSGAAALLLLSPATPLLFMGQEFDEPAPFQFFTDYADPFLKKAVSDGRRQEFADFDWGELPDPEQGATFERSHLRWDWDEDQVEVLNWYKDLLRLRRELVLSGQRTCRAEWEGAGVLWMQVPVEYPSLIVRASLPGGFLERQSGPGWFPVLTSDEDGYGIRVLRRG